MSAERESEAVPRACMRELSGYALTAFCGAQGVDEKLYSGIFDLETDVIELSAREAATLRMVSELTRLLVQQAIRTQMSETAR
jgi:hypothetical protein